MTSSFLPPNFDPFKFQCDHCDYQYVFTMEEIESTKQKTPNTDNDYHILCKKCSTGHMQPPTVVVSFTPFG